MNRGSKLFVGMFVVAGVCAFCSSALLNGFYPEQFFLNAFVSGLVFLIVLVVTTAIAFRTGQQGSSGNGEDK